ncbi:MAG: metallophosphoesterase family protein [Candidatus Nezhaarchaeota archaeon]|nr:metallophosphoesterase family protein [Candidatus Nezhaarchaeota archaeon]
MASDLHRALSWLRRAISYAEERGIGTFIYCGDLQSVEAARVLASFKGRSLAVPGNMDSYEELEALEEAGVSIHGRAVEHGGYLFAGAGGLGFREALNSLRDCLTRDPQRLVLVTHHPPKGLRVDLAMSLVHAGSLALRDFIVERRPVACLCGHIHEARGVDWLNDTLVVNPGPLARGCAAVVDLERREAELIEL